MAWVLDALLGSRHIDRIVVIGQDQRLEGVDGLERVDFLGDQGSLVADIYAGIARLTPGQQAAFCWADMPLLTSGAIDRFIDQVPEPAADVTCGVVEKSSPQHACPGADDPEMGLDVDNANNLTVCRRVLIARRAGP